MVSKAPPVRRFHSQAQREKAQRMVTDKIITQAQYDEMERNTPTHTPLPHRKHPK